MDEKFTVSSFARYRLERAKQDLSDAEFAEPARFRND